MKIMVSGLVNVETNIKIREFPVSYYPVDYPFFGIASSVGGVAYNVSNALSKLGNEVELISYTGKDFEAERIFTELEKNKIGFSKVRKELKETPVSAILYDAQGKRQIYCDLKDIQEKTYVYNEKEQNMDDYDIIVLCNINFNRELLKKAKKSGKIIATDVHVLSNIEDDYNKDFMECADILFLSDEQLPASAEEFILQIKERYPAKIVVIGRGSKGALLYDRERNQVTNLGAVKVGEVVNTVGAGDALFSSFLHFYGKGYEPVEALKRAEVFASAKIRESGAANGFIEEKEVEQLYSKGELKFSCK
ncbi:MAG: carbohydrate kinase family protein [Lachnospiraceae bacterium]|nr:carbohydrate kinase family protein [Lachnospiraceae bacterium]